jgi:elongation factor P
MRHFRVLDFWLSTLDPRLSTFTMLAKEIKPGTVVNHNDAPHIIESVAVQSPSARGSATLYKFRARNLVTKQKTDITLKGTEGLDDADFHRREVTFMYADAEAAHFLDTADYNQYTLPRDEVAGELQYITEDLQGMLALIYNGQCVGIQLPTAVDLKITQCDPAVKGNSATSRTKPATLETGVVVHVPEYLKQGETIRVDTRSGEFLSRV